MELLILGAQGQVGRALAQLAQREGLPHRALSRSDCDITDRAALEKRIRPGCIVVNCAAYTQVDRAEMEVEAAYGVNAVAVEHIAATCTEVEAPLIHLSTDYVFDGAGTAPAKEDDPPRPLGVYGRSKLAGEAAVRRRCRQHIILRMSWIFSPVGTNFVKTIMSLARESPKLRVVDDQVGAPTAAHDSAAAILKIVAASSQTAFSAWGTYHFCGAPAVSRHEFARAILADSKTEVTPVATDGFPMPAPRPPNSALDCSRVFRVFGIAQPDWRGSLVEVLRQLT